jgi:hypothetical protein
VTWVATLLVQVAQYTNNATHLATFVATVPPLGWASYQITVGRGAAARGAASAGRHTRPAVSTQVSSSKEAQGGREGDRTAALDAPIAIANEFYRLTFTGNTAQVCYSRRPF